MSLKQYLFLIISATAISIIAFLIVINSINPTATNLLGFTLFYLSLFFSVTGILALILFLFRNAFNSTLFLKDKVLISFRQAFLIGVLICVGLFLQSQKLIAWWNLIILILILFIIEYGFLAKENS